MDTKSLLLLGQLMAQHLDRSMATIAKRAGVHARLFARLEAGNGCHSDTLSFMTSWFSDNWPADLEWPRQIPRPPKSKKEAA